MKQSVLWLIRFYQRVLSLDQGVLGKIFPATRVCRFTPSCSEYTYEAVSRYGTISGLRMGLGRIFRCHPWSPGGFDPVKQS